MSLNFGAANSVVKFGIGNAAQLGNGAFTLLALWKLAPSNSNTGLVGGYSSTTERQSMLVDTQHLFATSDFSNGFGTLTAGDWYWLAVTKPAGANHYRMHFRDYTTAGAWSHGESVGAANHTDPGTSDNIWVGAASVTSAQGDVAVTAIWTSVLADLTIESAATSNLSDLMAQSPKWAAAFKNSAPTSIQDLTAGGGNETSRSGTITNTADPPSYNWTLSGGPSAAILGGFHAFF